MKKCFQHQFLIPLPVICYLASAPCSLARALFNPFNVHLSFVVLRSYYRKPKHSFLQFAVLSFLIIYAPRNYVHNTEMLLVWARSMKRKVFHLDCERFGPDSSSGKKPNQCGRKEITLRDFCVSKMILKLRFKSSKVESLMIVDATIMKQIC